MGFTYNFPRPAVTTDTLVFRGGIECIEVLLIKRKKEPYKDFWAIPGGFLEIEETPVEGAKRELLEETSLEVELDILLGIYSDPKRDFRGHTACAVFVGNASGKPAAADDAKDIALFDPYNVDVELAFDHRQILEDYCDYRRDGTIKLPL